MVVAPALVPKRSGERVKTNWRDGRLSQSLRPVFALPQHRFKAPAPSGSSLTTYRFTEGDFRDTTDLCRGITTGEGTTNSPLAFAEASH